MVRRRPRLSFSQIVERMAVLSAPRHRDLVRAMVSEFDTIADPAQRRSFAMGVILAIARMALSRFSAMVLGAPSRLLCFPETVTNLIPRDPPMPTIPAEQLLRRHVIPFAVGFTLLTALQLANFAARQFPLLSARGASIGTLLEALVLAVPFTIALSVPMAVFIAVSWVFSRLGIEGILLAVHRERHGFRRLVSPVLGAAAVIAALMFVSNAQILPQANKRLATLIADSPVQANDRSMTLGELRQAARSALTDARPGAAARAVAYQVEIQKKLALPAACLVLALAAVAIAFRFPRGGIRLVMGASAILFIGYYISLVVGEALADQRVISPGVGMWTANVILLSIVLLLLLPTGKGEIQTAAA